jgi:hypothetical protein
MTGFINNHFMTTEKFKPKRIESYNTLALPALLYNSESLTVAAKRRKKRAATDEVCEDTLGQFLQQIQSLLTE